MGNKMKWKSIMKPVVSKTGLRWVLRMSHVERCEYTWVEWICRYMSGKSQQRTSTGICILSEKDKKIHGMLNLRYIPSEELERLRPQCHVWIADTWAQEVPDHPNDTIHPATLTPRDRRRHAAGVNTWRQCAGGPTLSKSRWGQRETRNLPWYTSQLPKQTTPPSTRNSTPDELGYSICL